MVKHARPLTVWHSWVHDSFNLQDTLSLLLPFQLVEPRLIDGGLVAANMKFRDPGGARFNQPLPINLAFNGNGNPAWAS